MIGPSLWLKINMTYKLQYRWYKLKAGSFCQNPFLTSARLYVQQLSVLSGKISIFQEEREILKYLFTSKVRLKMTTHVKLNKKNN